MLSKLLDLSLPVKLGILAGVLVALLGSVAIYGHVQYNKGIKYCQDNYAQEEARYQKDKTKQERKKANETLKQESDLSKQLGNLQANKEKGVNETRDKAIDYPESCNLSPDLVRDFQETVRN